MICASKTHEEWAVRAAGVHAAGFKNLRSMGAHPNNLSNGGIGATFCASK